MMAQRHVEEMLCLTAGHLVRTPSSILICSIRLIGDVVLATPLIALLKGAFPDAAIDILVNRKTGEFLEKDPRVRRVIYSEQIDVDRNENVKAKGYTADILQKYDMAINMNASDRGNLATLLAGRHYRIGFYEGRSLLKDFWKRFLFSQPILYPPDVHRACLCKLVAEAIGIPATKLEAKVYWDEADERWVDALLSERGAGERFFVVHPFARWRYKYWSLDRFIEVSDAIAEQYGLQPVWTSSPLEEEVSLLKETTGACRYRPVLIAGELSLNQMTCLLSRASLYLGLDTAVSHLAATTGVPMLVIFGPTPAALWAPWNNQVPADEQCRQPGRSRRLGHIALIQKDWECLPCGQMGCKGKTEDSPCLLAIETAEVLDAVKGLLETTHSVRLQ